MSVISVNPFMLKNCTFAVASDNYEAHVSQVEFVPSSTTATFKGLTPVSVFTFGSNATWVCNLALAQDWSTANSLSRYLYDHEGEEIDVVFSPIAGGVPLSATLIVAPGSIGGTVDSVATSTVALAVLGKPAFGDTPVVDNQWAVSITGTPAGGSYVLTFNGYATAPLVYNATTSAVDAAIEALSGVTGISGVTVTGTAASYTIVFPESVTMSASHTFTGGTSPAIGVATV